MIFKGVSDFISIVVAENIEVCFVANIVVSVIIKVGVDSVVENILGVEKHAVLDACLTNVVEPM